MTKAPAVEIGDICIACGTVGWDAAVRGLLRCRLCGLMKCQPVAMEARAIYGASYFKGGDYPDYVGQERALRKSMRRHVSQMMAYGPLGPRLLEIGCAYGFFLDEARSVFADVVGVDICEAAVSRARAMLGVDARSGDALSSTHYEAETYDVACLWDTIEHLEHPDTALRNAARALRDSGLLFLTTADAESLNATLRAGRWRQIHPPTHLYYFGRVSIGKFLDRCGFDTLGIETASYYHTLLNILRSIQLRGGVAGSLSGSAVRILGERLAGRLGAWVNLGDIMFVAARKRPRTGVSREQSIPG